MLALLIVGGTSRSYISVHKSTKDHFKSEDFDLLCLLIKDYAEIVIVAHVVAETSNLIRQIGEPRRTEIQRVFGQFIAQTYEIPVASVTGINRDESVRLGVTDGVLLHLCSLSLGDAPPTLLTIDGRLADLALARGYKVINYERDYQS